MGNTSSVPFGKNYQISYCKHSKLKCVNGLTSETNLINGIKINNKNHINLILSVFYNKINANGYSLKYMDNHLLINLPLDEVINSIIKKGFYSSGHQKKLSDIIINPKCYIPKLKNIRSLVYMGNVLIAGLVIDSEFSKNILKCELKEIVTEIVLIVGYTEKSILIKGIWNNELLSIPNEYIDYIKEIWNIEIESPEDKYNIESP